MDTQPLPDGVGTVDYTSAVNAGLAQAAQINRSFIKRAGKPALYAAAATVAVTGIVVAAKSIFGEHRPKYTLKRPDQGVHADVDRDLLFACFDAIWAADHAPQEHMENLRKAIIKAPNVNTANAVLVLALENEPLLRDIVANGDLAKARNALQECGAVWMSGGEIPANLKRFEAVIRRIQKRAESQPIGL